MSLTCYLIRHGETPWSITGQHTGLTDIGLTPKGQEEARRLGPLLAGVEFSAVYSSPLGRATATCDLAGFKARRQLNPDLAEWDYGDYEGTTSEKIHETDPDWSLFTHGAPGGESPEQVSQRADRVIDWLRPMRGNVAIFSHSHFSCALATRWIGLPIAEAEHLELSTGSISKIGYSKSHPETHVVSGWNITT